MVKFKRVLFVANTSDSALTPGFKRALALAKAHQAHFTFLSVVTEFPNGDMLARFNITAEQAKLRVKESEGKRLIQMLVEAGLEENEFDLKVSFGKLYVEAVREVLRSKADIVVKQVEDPSWLDGLFGSDDMHLLRKCPAAVWLVQPTEKQNYQHVCAAIDFESGFESDDATSLVQANALNDAIIELSVTLCLSELANLHLVHAYDVPHAGFVSLWSNEPYSVENELVTNESYHRRTRCDALLTKVNKQIGDESYQYLVPKVHLKQGEPQRQIPNMVNDVGADLVVMGTIARTGVAGVIIGNTAEAILSQLKCSVLAIKPTGFETPITLD